MSPELGNHDHYLGPRSRQGRFNLAVSATLALVAVTAGMLWTNAKESRDDGSPEPTPVDSPTPIIWGEEALSDQISGI